MKPRIYKGYIPGHSNKFWILQVGIRKYEFLFWKSAIKALDKLDWYRSKSVSN